MAMALPLFTCGVAAVMVSKLYWIWPPIRSVSIGPEPLYGTWIALTLAGQHEHLQRQVLRRAGAGGAEADLAGVGLRHSSTRSFTVLAGWCSLQISRLGVTPTSTIGWKSLAGS